MQKKKKDQRLHSYKVLFDTQIKQNKKKFGQTNKFLEHRNSLRKSETKKLEEIDN